MDPIHKKALRCCQADLIQNITYNQIKDDLQNEIFTPLMMQYFDAEAVPAEKVRHMLGDLAKRGPEAYDKFIKILRDNEHGFVADIIIRKEKELRQLNG